MVLTHIDSLLNTIRQTDYYLITEDFDSCMYCVQLSVSVESHIYADIAALQMVDEAYLGKWMRSNVADVFIVPFRQGRMGQEVD